MPRSFDLGPHFEKVVDDLVSEGRYPDADTALRRAVSMLEEAETERAAKLSELRALIQEGIESGPGEEWNLEDTRARLHERYRTFKRAAE